MSQDNDAAQKDDFISLAELTPAQWKARLLDEFPDFIQDLTRLSFDIPTGFRELVETALEAVREKCDIYELAPGDEHYPQLFQMRCVNGLLVLNITHGQYRTLEPIEEAIRLSAMTCQRCGEHKLRLEDCEIKRKEASRFEPQTETWRLCANCAQAVKPKADPATSVQVMHAIAGSGERGSDRTLKDYAHVLVERRIPVATTPDLAYLAGTLRREFPWFEAVTRRVMRALVLRQAGDGWFKFRPLLLCGPPGSGKTSYAQRLAELSGTAWRVVPLAGENSSMLFKGAARGWASARPGMVIELIKEKEIANPIVVLDEIDKAGGSSRNGRVEDALIPLLEVASAKNFFDGYLQGEADLSVVNWIATANEYRYLSKPLLNRFEVVHVGMPGKQDYEAIVQRTMRRYALECGIRSEMMPRLDPLHWQYLSRFFTSPRSARRATEAFLGSLMANPALTGERLQ